MKPKRIEFECGETRHSQAVTIEISYNQHYEEVQITKHAVSQRDETQKIFGLSVDNILKMAQAIKEYKDGN